MKKNIFGADTKTQELVPAISPKPVLITQKKLLLEGRADEVIQKMISIALNDGHPGQATCLKMFIDRVLPVSEFEKDKVGGVKTVFVDRSCQGKVTITTGGNSITMNTDEFLTVEEETNG